MRVSERRSRSRRWEGRRGGRGQRTHDESYAEKLSRGRWRCDCTHISFSGVDGRLAGEQVDSRMHPPLEVLGQHYQQERGPQVGTLRRHATDNSTNLLSKFTPTFLLIYYGFWHMVFVQWVNRDTRFPYKHVKPPAAIFLHTLKVEGDKGTCRQQHG